MKGGRREADSTLIADRDLENILTFVFSGFSFILHLAHHLATLSRSLCRYSAAKSIFFLYSQPIGLRHLQIVTY